MPRWSKIRGPRRALESKATDEAKGRDVYAKIIRRRGTSVPRARREKKIGILILIFAFKYGS